MFLIVVKVTTIVNCHSPVVKANCFCSHVEQKHRRRERACLADCIPLNFEENRLVLLTLNHILITQTPVNNVVL